ncbi:hypothetical protein ACLB2K_008751 [Fragaria x ananassa]
MWAYMLSWLTPSSLIFLFLNLTIGTIVICHRFHKTPQHQEHQHPSLLQRVRSFDFSRYNFQPDPPENPTGLVRTPSLMERLRSIKFSQYNFQQPYPEPDHVMEYPAPENPTGIVRTPSLLDRVRSFNYSFQQQEHVTEDTTPDHPTGIVRTPSLLARFKPMESKDLHMVNRSKSDTGHEESRPEKVIKKSNSERGYEENDGGDVTGVRPRRVVEKTMSFGDDEGVDAKADDFINRFKQQLKLQRLDSLLRYKEMLQRN